MCNLHSLHHTSCSSFTISAEIWSLNGKTTRTVSSVSLAGDKGRCWSQTFESTKLLMLELTRCLGYFKRENAVFNCFRKTCEEIYKLDPANYITAASLSWATLLKKTSTQKSSQTSTCICLLRAESLVVSTWHARDMRKPTTRT